MAYTRAWDETSPLDTQAASLFGQDIRNLETDIRERVESFGAGLLANRPTPEAAWGSANFGVMYYATDTNQIFRWNNAAWVDVSDELTLTDMAATVLVANGTLNGITIPAAYLRVNSIIRVRAVILAASGNPSVNLVTNSATLFSFSVPSNTAPYFIDFMGIPTAAANIRWFYLTSTFDTPSKGFGSQYNSGDTIANALNISLTVTAGTGVFSVTSAGIAVTVRH